MLCVAADSAMIEAVFLILVIAAAGSR